MYVRLQVFKVAAYRHLSTTFVSVHSKDNWEDFFICKWKHMLLQVKLRKCFSWYVFYGMRREKEKNRDRDRERKRELKKCFINIRRNWCYLAIILPQRVCVAMALPYRLNFLNSHSCRTVIHSDGICLYFLTPMYSKCFTYVVTHPSMKQYDSPEKWRKGKEMRKSEGQKVQVRRENERKWNKNTTAMV